ncbi:MULTISPECIES: AfsR/SARP family transcriptional regulator [Streptomyces]|uniref:AfsR/SARP family transcriptional regulator n=1 Tax=Streptomyces TaxID=1883 RepID=UPI00163C533E|nr:MULTISPECIES: BTAD domain-containing putative transcriptional regulator [Streptomyces]MBC2878670.1 winged helix-turn-helix domain-containing protein [Streptomyces sp. TYQ1024]UBI35116.1 winged helix-turn-helix domain-containing protein [Streptomyces mobaraensis]UKW27710.1 winged helix-turn-helix domain-containing protein [Streptomyces sp. TYQ1024]
MRYGVLGPLAVWDGRGEPVRVPEAKVRALLADLLAHEGRPVPADRLVDDLWGDRPPGNPANALQAKVSQLRKALGRDRVVRQIPGYRLHLDPADDEVDADRFRSLVDAARRETAPRARAALLTEALELWRGPAYADFADEEFARAAVRRLGEQRLAVLEEQAEARLDAGDHLLLTGELTDLVARHPLRERLRAVQLRALYRSGRQSDALASYTDLRNRLRAELGLDPGPELVALHEAILRQDASLALGPGTGPGTVSVSVLGSGSASGSATELPPASDTSPRPPSNLPVPLTALIGRDRSLTELDGLLRTERLVTLTGPGGVGKTRLAVEAAARLVRAASPGTPADAPGPAPDGVWLVELAGRHGSAAVLAQAVSATLGIRDDVPSGLPAFGGAAPTPVERLTAALRDRRTLLVLDNCEQVVDAAAELVALLLRTAPGLRVLATSREPLGLMGETVFLVEPLASAEAAELFMARAAAAAPGFSPTQADDGTRDAVAEICRRLDGLPLALELAATRVRALGVKELAARLGDRFRVLASGSRGAPARQQTLRAMIDWSWELLGAPERIVLRRLAVHADGCTLDAAEAVCAGDGVAAEEVLDLMTRLVDRSLVVRVDGPPGTGPRYRLLESVAAYAMERLHEMEDLTGVRDRHLRHYLDLAERAEPRLRGGEQRTWLARLDADAANLRAALDEAVRRAGAGCGTDEAVRLATALCWWWLLRGRLHEGRRTLAAVLAAAPDAAGLRTRHRAFALLTGDRSGAEVTPEPGTGDPARHGRTLWLLAHGLFGAGSVAASEELNARALALFTEAGDRWGTAAALGLRATHALARGDLGTVARDGLRSAALFRELGDRWGELQTVQPLAVLAEIKGDYADAARRHHEALRIARDFSLHTEVSARLSGLGRLALLAKDWDRARDLHERARRLAVEQGYRYGEIHSDMGLALGARRSGDLDAAETFLTRIRDGHADVSSPAGDHLLHAEFGFTAELRGDARAAAAHHLAGLDIARSLAEPRALALSLEGLAGVAALVGGPDHATRAAWLLGAADAARRGVGAPLPDAERGDVDRVTEAATAAIGPHAFADAFREGASRSLEEAVLAAREVLAALE